MCGIVGYTGRQSAIGHLIEGLRRLEYRGYDSAGIALGTPNKLYVEKRAGKLVNLENSLGDAIPAATSGIGHTRWATHGGPSDKNAHPHCDNEGKLAVIHNGIIENYSQLRIELESRGHTFDSETDTESVAHLLSDLRKSHKGDLASAMREAVKKLRGSFTLLAIHSDNPEVIVGVRRNSPLVVGLGDGENFLASDVSAFIEYTKRAVALGQDEVVTITPNLVSVTDLKGREIVTKEYEITWDSKAAEKGGFTHFMLKEIYQQPVVLEQTIKKYLTGNELDKVKIDWNKIDSIKILACGTAYYSGLVAKYWLEELTNIFVDLEVASEFRYRRNAAKKNEITIVISQSGETLDTLEALRKTQSYGQKTIAILNTENSSIGRIADYILPIMVGPEIGVASTKAFLGQLMVIAALGLDIGLKKGNISQNRFETLTAELSKVPNLI
ncbi:MAG: glutamine--fructose-6-phosphate transaminase (isomerizing), partial [Actinobacteria bacterium]|nr:glutamine--fructose-6-phosphate transaminase (isomerizing) [Actinomycetota bacterium]